MIVRADGGTRIGAGHIMRCLALALEWQTTGGKAVFVSHCDSDALKARIQDAGIELISPSASYPDASDLALMQRLARDLAPADTWVILDGYHFDISFQRALKDIGFRLLVIDDTAHQTGYIADIILNQNFGAESLVYKCETNTRLLLGTRYTLLRPEFKQWHGREREFPSRVRNILVTMGAADPDNATCCVLRALKSLDLPDTQVKVLAGPAFSHFEELSLMSRNDPGAFKTVRNPFNVSDLMAWADVAITAGGSTLWELAFMRIPAAVVILADNQEPGTKALADDGALYVLGKAQDPELSARLGDFLRNTDRLREFARVSGSLVDGYGARRVIEAMERSEKT
ncbi:UDP-2,4-diacetamido-2,4,6-trideoxy-beta-L-altropyranose hydrolase [Desulfomonile tiedjei]|nr:UDP-2,4-diacetamido-2,4,6-trideoxy-beta-L-altropyranose hydrolase [Desulfomonile tiedjei]